MLLALAWPGSGCLVAIWGRELTDGRLLYPYCSNSFLLFNKEVLALSMTGGIEVLAPHLWACVGEVPALS